MATPTPIYPDTGDVLKALGVGIQALKDAAAASRATDPERAQQLDVCRGFLLQLVGSLTSSVPPDVKAGTWGGKNPGC